MEALESTADVRARTSWQNSRNTGIEMALRSALHAEFRRAKIEGNRARDHDTDRRLADAGWLAVRVWEHETVEDAAARVDGIVRARRREPAAKRRGATAG
ncbi:hypothetical protein [Streptomyces sp. NPDC001194]|uniref:hypothetical protein n=1 Tax=Streptomyces sp. NPDC001194 TaxID=3364547 RepID=UPI0036BE092D